MMAYTVFKHNQEYGPRKGLEGPFVFVYRVLYYSPKDGQYWDPKTDFFLDHDEAAELQNSIFDAIRG